MGENSYPWGCFFRKHELVPLNTSVSLSGGRGGEGVCVKFPADCCEQKQLQ